MWMKLKMSRALGPGLFDLQRSASNSASQRFRANGVYSSLTRRTSRQGSHSGPVPREEDQ
jgi:hypothetical protein